MKKPFLIASILMKKMNFIKKVQILIIKLADEAIILMKFKVVFIVFDRIFSIKLLF